MSTTLDLRKYITKYGIHKISVYATGEGFRNSATVEQEYDCKPFVSYEIDYISVRNIQPGVSKIDLYVDGTVEKTIEHDTSLTDDITVDLTDTSITGSTIKTVYVIVTTDYGEFKSNETTTAQVYGVKGLYDKANTLTRTDHAVDKTYTINNGKVTSDFDELFPYCEMKEVTDDYGNVFVTIPEMWWRIETDDDHNIMSIAVCKDKKLDGKWFRSDAFQVGKYLAYNENGKMVSKSGKSQGQNYSAVGWTAYATANGDGYKPIGLYEQTILDFLWLVEFANKDSKQVMAGYYYNNSVTGLTDSISDSTGYLPNTNGKMKYRGIEDFTGNDCVWCPDITTNYYVTRDVNYYKAGTTGKKQLCYWENVKSMASWSWKCVMALGWDDDNPFFCFPSKIGSNGQSTEYFKAGMYGPYNSADYCGRAKFYTNYNTTYNTQLFSFIMEYNYNSTNDQTTSRLVRYI